MTFLRQPGSAPSCPPRVTAPLAWGGEGACRAFPSLLSKPKHGSWGCSLRSFGTCKTRLELSVRPCQHWRDRGREIQHEAGLSVPAPRRSSPQVQARLQGFPKPIFLLCFRCPTSSRGLAYRPTEAGFHVAPKAHHQESQIMGSFMSLSLWPRLGFTVVGTAGSCGGHLAKRRVLGGLRGNWKVHLLSSGGWTWRPDP